MNTFLYIIIFIMGTLFGSFYTLAVYRIPRKIDIVKTHSFCPNCKHKLGFFELIPVLSYIILGGKCKECKQKIRPRYFILEFLSGIAFVLIAYCLKINAYTINLPVVLNFSFIVLYLVALFIIAGIDKEFRKIERGVLYYGLMVSCFYIIYLCIMVNDASIHRYVMYLITLIILLIIDSETQIKTAKSSYTIEMLILTVIMLINTGIIVTCLTALIVFLAIGITKIIYNLKNELNKSRKEQKNMIEIYKFGYLFSLTNIILFIGKLYFMYH